MRHPVSVVTGCSHLPYAFSFTISVIMCLPIIIWAAVLIRILVTNQIVLLNHIARAGGKHSLHDETHQLKLHGSKAWERPGLLSYEA